MQIGLIGLGRMGSNIVRRLTQAGHRCVVFDRDATAIKRLQGPHIAGAADLKALVRQLEIPRAVWVMVPAGAPTEDTVAELGALLEAGDIIIDGGNSFYKDDIRRAKELATRGIAYVDCGTSGGIWGLERGYCLMIGGLAKRSSISTRSSPPSPLAPATFRTRPDGTAAIPGSSAAICIAAEAAPAIS